MVTIEANEILLDQVLELAEHAAKKILKVYHSDNFETELKEDNSPVTKADKESSEYLIRELNELTDLPVLSEEAVIPFEERKTWKQFWIIDPLDGTKDFISRDDEFTINIALIDDGIPILGVVAAPALGVAYGAVHSLGAYKYKSGKKEKINYTSTRTELICTDSRFHSSDQVTVFCKKNSITQIDRCGSTIKICKLAEGLVDVYPRFGPTMEWDIAAADCIAHEAGCQVISLQNRKRLVYNKEDLRNPGFIACPLNSRFFW